MGTLVPSANFVHETSFDFEILTEILQQEGPFAVHNRLVYVLGPSNMRYTRKAYILRRQVTYYISISTKFKDNNAI